MYNNKNSSYRTCIADLRYVRYIVSYEHVEHVASHARDDICRYDMITTRASSVNFWRSSALVVMKMLLLLLLLIVVVLRSSWTVLLVLSSGGWLGR